MVNGDHAPGRLLKQRVSRPPLHKHPVGDLRQPARDGDAIGQRLGRVASLANLDAAWHQYEFTLREVKAADLQLLRPIEVAIDEGDQEWPDRLPTRIHPVSLAIRSELQDTWARLRARQLIERLKASGSLRALATRIHVSAPYLSQLSDGAGPVPSASIISRLEVGLEKVAQEIPAPPIPPPHEALESLLDRIERASEQLARLSRQRVPPTVSVEYPNVRKRKHLEDCLRAVAERFVDPDEGDLIEELITAIVSADRPNLAQWARLTRDDGWKDLATLIAALGDDQRDAFIALVRTLTTPQPLPQPNPVKKSAEPN